MSWPSYYYITKTNERDERKQNSDAHNSVSRNALKIPVAPEKTVFAVESSVVTFRWMWDCVLLGIRAEVTAAPSSTSVIVDVNVNGVSCLSTKCSIDVGETYSVTAASQSVLTSDPFYMADGDLVEIDIDQTDATATALKVTFMVRLYPYVPNYPLLRQ